MALYFAESLSTLKTKIESKEEVPEIGGSNEESEELDVADQENKELGGGAPGGHITEDMELDFDKMSREIKNKSKKGSYK